MVFVVAFHATSKLRPCGNNFRNIITQKINLCLSVLGRPGDFIYYPIHGPIDQSGLHIKKIIFKLHVNITVTALFTLSLQVH